MTALKTFLTQASCVPCSETLAPRSKHAVERRQRVAGSCGTALVYCVGSRTARHSGLSGSCSPVETAARSPDACGSAGISAARSLSPPSGAFYDEQELTAQPRGTALPWKGWSLAGVTWPRGFRVPMGMWQVPLDAFQEMEVLGAGCPSAGGGRTSSRLAAFPQLALGILTAAEGTTRAWYQNQ